MKSREQKLLELLNSKNYKSKIRLYCPETKLNLIRFASVENKSHICRIKIEEL